MPNRPRKSWFRRQVAQGQRSLRQEQGRKDAKAGRAPVSPNDPDYMQGYNSAMRKRANELGGA